MLATAICTATLNCSRGFGFLFSHCPQFSIVALLAIMLHDNDYSMIMTAQTEKANSTDLIYIYNRMGW